MLKETNFQEIWQVDVGGDLYETNLQEMANWIFDGTLQPEDKVRRGNLRWIEARKVPHLLPFFNAKDQGAPLTILTAITDAQPTNNFNSFQNPLAQNSFQSANFQTPPAPDSFQTANFQTQADVFQTQQPQQNFLPPTQQFIPPIEHFQPFAFGNFVQPEIPPLQDSCILHASDPAKYFCETCFNVFCQSCPKGYGGNVRICPMCGSMCKSIGMHQAEREKALNYQRDMQEGFSFGDFGKALAYPFKFKVSLFFGAILFMLFSLGQMAAGSGSFMMFSAVLICFMLANMISFSVLANTVENFSQGKITKNFMPDFDEFSLWDDVVQPFFLNIGVFIVSFGLLVVVTICSVWIMWGNVKDSLKTESDKRMEVVKKQKEITLNANQNQHWESDKDRAFREDLEAMNKQTQINNLKSMGVADPESDMAFGESLSIAMKSSGFLIILILLAFLWGIFYYPIACTVAGYSRSFSATINPTVGLEAIKLLGTDYIKILVMTLILSVTVAIIEFIFHFILSAFNLPGMGNIPAVAISSLFKFYFYIVFAVVLGYALYKNASKFNFRLV